MTSQFNCYGLFDQVFTPANFGNKAEQATFRLFMTVRNFFRSHFGSFFPFQVDIEVPFELPTFKPENMLLLLLLIFTPAPIRSDWASNTEAASNLDDLIEKEIFFNEVSKIPPD